MLKGDVSENISGLRVISAQRGRNDLIYTNFTKNYNFSFFFGGVEKVSSGMWEMCPKI